MNLIIVTSLVIRPQTTEERKGHIVQPFSQRWHHASGPIIPCSFKFCLAYRLIIILSRMVIHRHPVFESVHIALPSSPVPWRYSCPKVIRTNFLEENKSSTKRKVRIRDLVSHQEDAALIVVKSVLNQLHRLLQFLPYCLPLSPFHLDFFERFSMTSFNPCPQNLLFAWGFRAVQKPHCEFRHEGKDFDHHKLGD